MVSYHDLALAAVGIVLKVERFPLNVGIGICQGMMPLVAYSYAAGDKKRMDDTISLSLKLGLGIAVVSIALYEIFAVQFTPSLYARSRYRGAGLAVPSNSGAGNTADVYELFYRTSVPGLRTGADRPLFWARLDGWCSISPCCICSMRFLACSAWYGHRWRRTR